MELKHVPSQGFLYIATGKRFIEEAKQSVSSLKKHMPTAKTCCFTDDLDSARGHFDTVQLLTAPHRNFFEKIPPLSLSPFDATIFVDTDTIFAAPMLEVFDLLNRFEIAVVDDPYLSGREDIPSCFAHMNTGLIAYRNSQRVRSFFTKWLQAYEEDYAASEDKEHEHDQGSFQSMLYHSDLRLYILPVEYNFRLTSPQMARVWARIKMIHARHPRLQELSEELNKEWQVRVVWPNWTHFFRSKLFLVDQRQGRFIRLPHSLVGKIFRLLFRKNI